jgi:hypothetical protein
VPHRDDRGDRCAGHRLRTAVDQKTDAQCEALVRPAAAKPNQKPGLVTAYGARVDALAAQGFLTAAQATQLKERAARL